MKNVPLRKCVITNEKLPKNELIRIVKTKADQVVVDPTGKQNGHGVYIKKDYQTIIKAKTSKKLNKMFDTNIAEEIYEELLNIIK